MASRLFHTLVVSSVMTLDGCTISHSLATDAGDDDPPDGGGDLDAGDDAGFDADVPDAGVDAGLADAGFDAGIADAALLDADVRFCEPGWPTTKGMVCVDQGDGTVECCRLWLGDGSMDTCCIGVVE